MAMTEYEWETEHVPRTPKADLLAFHHPRHRAVAEFASLEHPRESLGWILKQRP